MLRTDYRAPACNQKGGWQAATVSEFTPGQWVLDIYGKHAGEVLSDPARRRVSGSILSVETLTSGMTAGSCLLLFERKYVVVAMGTADNPIIIPYAETSSGGGLQRAIGRAAMTVRFPSVISDNRIVLVPIDTSFLQSDEEGSEPSRN
jgi:hypothetical protein